MEFVKNATIPTMLMSEHLGALVRIPLMGDTIWRVTKAEEDDAVVGNMVLTISLYEPLKLNPEGKITLPRLAPLEVVEY